MTMFWIAATCRIIPLFQICGRKCCLHLQGDRIMFRWTLDHFFISLFSFFFFSCPPPPLPLVIQLYKFGHGFTLCASQYYHCFHDEVIGLMPNPQPGGPGFDFGVLFSRKVGNRLRILLKGIRLKEIPSS